MSAIQGATLARVSKAVSAQVGSADAGDHCPLSANGTAAAEVDKAAFPTDVAGIAAEEHKANSA